MPYDQAWILATDAGEDCGSVDFEDNPYQSTDAGAVAWSVDCAFAAQDAGKPFVLVVGFYGVDTSTVTAYLRLPDGLSYAVRQPRSNCTAAELDGAACASFVPDTFAAPGYDAGLPGIGCDREENWACICFDPGCF
jgi:hypothetical protein